MEVEEVEDGGYCVSVLIRDKEKDENGVSSDKEVLVINRR